MTQPLSNLDPTAPSFSMPSQVNPKEDLTPLPTTNGVSQKQSKGPEKNAALSVNMKPAPPDTGAKLSGADLKKQKAAEKAARRAEKVQEKTIQAAPPTQANFHSTTSKPDSRRRPSDAKKDADLAHRKRTMSTSTPSRPLILRPNNAASSTTVDPTSQPSKSTIEMFLHLQTAARPTLSTTHREVHPAVLSLGLQLRDRVICGSTARLAATLLALKKAILSYTTPPGTALPLSLNKYLGHQVGYLSASRNLSVGQGNAIRWLKQIIGALDPALADLEAKDVLSREVDVFLREKIVLADELISKKAREVIERDGGDVVLTYGKSSLVEKALLDAHAEGKRFRVIVADSRPLFEGRNLVKSLGRAGIRVQYVLITGLAGVMGDVTKCILGAGAMFRNGALYSRAGTAIVAMMAKQLGRNVTVSVLCETIKFVSEGRIALDSISTNELGNPDALIDSQRSGDDVLTASVTQPEPAPVAAGAGSGGKKKGGKAADAEHAAAESATKREKRGLEGWRDQQNLHLLNLMYDVTPKEFIDVVISELGSQPSGGLPAVNDDGN